jgi:hypothetical protein
MDRFLILVMKSESDQVTSLEIVAVTAQRSAAQFGRYSPKKSA